MEMVVNSNGLTNNVMNAMIGEGLFMKSFIWDLECANVIVCLLLLLLF